MRSRYIFVALAVVAAACSPGESGDPLVETGLDSGWADTGDTFTDTGPPVLEALRVEASLSDGVYRFAVALPADGDAELVAQWGPVAMAESATWSGGRCYELEAAADGRAIDDLLLTVQTNAGCVEVVGANRSPTGTCELVASSSVSCW